MSSVMATDMQQGGGPRMKRAPVRTTMPGRSGVGGTSTSSTIQSSRVQGTTGSGFHFGFWCPLTHARAHPSNAVLGCFIAHPLLNHHGLDVVFLTPLFFLLADQAQDDH
jgi:hypothetical protein